MSKLNNLFNEAKKNKKKIFIGFVTSGDPDYKSSKEIILNSGVSLFIKLEVL